MVCDRSVRHDAKVADEVVRVWDVDDLPTAAADCGAAAPLHKQHLSSDMATRLWRAAH